jgi:predicted MFS family arabinose efflux permease
VSSPWPALVYAFIRAASNGWGDHLTLAAFVLAVVLLVTFVRTEAITKQPVTPLRLFADRTRAASYVARVLVVGAMFGMFFFLTQFVQDVLGFSPVKAGLSFLPMTVALFTVSRLAPRLMVGFGAKPLMLAGLAPAVTGLAWLGQISPAGVAPEESGAALAMVNVTQQVGGALGLAALVTVYGHAARSARADSLAASPLARAHDVLAHGVAASFATAAVFDTLAILVIIVAVRRRLVIRA